MVVEVACKLLFLNNYGDFETVKRGDQAVKYTVVLQLLGDSC